MQLNIRLLHFLLVILPIFMAISAMTFGVGYVLNGIAFSVNEQEDRRTWLAVQAAVSSNSTRLATLSYDNAYWDAVFPHVYVEFDAGWVNETWGRHSGDDNYDIFMIVNAEGDTLASYAYGEELDLTFSEFLGPQAAPMASSLPKDNSTFETIETLADTQFGLTFVAASPMIPSTVTLKIPDGQPYFMVFGKVVTPELLEEMGEAFAVDKLDIRLISAAGPGDFTLFSTWGTPIATATWEPRLPGDAAKDAYNSTASAMIALLLLAMLPISISHFVTLRRLDRGERTAIAESRRDTLSGIPNRLRIIEETTRNLEISRPGELSMLFLDLDGFKAVNDFYDHEVGDSLIVAFARRVQVLVEHNDTFARLGGDEFAFLVLGQDAVSRSEGLAKAIIELVQEPFDLGGRLVTIGVSVGIANLGEARITVPELMRRADVAMYEAKALGGNHWRLFDLNIDIVNSEDFGIATEMRDILRRVAFEVAYQPIFAADDRSIIGIEALARWPKTSAREITPEELIRIAEENGLINSLGSQILDIACRDIANWKNLILSVNVSPMQLSGLNFVPEIKKVAAAHGLPLSRLEIEITERAVIRNARAAKRVIDELHEEGAKVSLDDFGIGYASLGYLRELNFDKVKLDKLLTQSFAESRATRSIVEGTILIAKGLSVDIVAEGVETEEHAKSMCLAGCSHLQGFYLGEPQTFEALRKMFPFHEGKQQ